MAACTAYTDLIQMCRFLDHSRPFEKAVIHHLRKTPSLEKSDVANYHPVFNLPFLGKVIERGVTDQLQASLGNFRAVEPFHCGFRPGYKTRDSAGGFN